jgi:L-lactate dehydrogenase complex protein LldG
MSGPEARAEILHRIRAALGPSGPAGDGPDVPRAYAHTVAGDSADARIERFGARVADYRARVRRLPDTAALAVALGALVREAPAPFVVPAGLPAAWTALVEAGRLRLDDDLDAHALDDCAGAITGCRLAIAETGTIVLDGGEGQGRRALTLVPDRLVVVVRASAIVATVPEAMRALAPTARAGPHALTFVSGPSATSDIELSRVEGVHGPRQLEVLIVDRM